MELIISSVLIGIIIILSVVHLIIHKRKSGRLLEKIPGPAGLPLLGNAHSFGVSQKRTWDLLRYYSKKYYPTYKLWILHWPVVNIMDPEDIEIVLSSQKHIRKSVFYDSLHEWLNEGLLTSDGNKWRQRRKTLTPAFHYNVLQDFVQVFIENSERMIKSLRKEGDQVVKDVFEYFGTYTINAICETAMGTSILDENETLLEEYRNAVRKMGEYVYYRGPRPWLRNNWIFSWTAEGREQRRELKILHRFTEKIIERRKRFHEETGGKYLKVFSSDNDLDSNVPSYDIPLVKKRMAMLDLLIAVQKERAGIEDIGIREEVDTFIFEGHDTTNSALSFAVAVLAENPEIQQRARQEIMEVLEESNGKLGITELQRLKYLERCLKESMRLFPPVPNLSRHLVEDLQLKHFLIPSGTVAVVHPPDVHRDENNWPKPNLFDPDRFLPEAIQSRHPYAYIPFSAGPRNCIGQKFAMLELKSFVAPILHNFYLEPIIETSRAEMIMDLVTKSLDPINVKFVPIPRL